jgi:hypothetical protein
MKEGEEFDWPFAPLARGGSCDLRIFTDAPESAAFTTHLMDPARRDAFFVAWSPDSSVAFGYLWPRADFPWLGIWEENCSRDNVPWSGRTLTRGMEFGVSPIPETRRQMLARGSLFGTPCFRWMPARSRVVVRYCAAVGSAARPPRALVREGDGAVRFE